MLSATVPKFPVLANRFWLAPPAQPEQMFHRPSSSTSQLLLSVLSIPLPAPFGLRVLLFTASLVFQIPSIRFIPVQLFLIYRILCNRVEFIACAPEVCSLILQLTFGPFQLFDFSVQRTDHIVFFEFFAIIPCFSKSLICTPDLPFFSLIFRSVSSSRSLS